MKTVVYIIPTSITPQRSTVRPLIHDPKQPWDGSGVHLRNFTETVEQNQTKTNPENSLTKREGKQLCFACTLDPQTGHADLVLRRSSPL